MKKMKKLFFVAVMLVAVLALNACTAVQVSGQLVLNSDGSGTRTITGMIAKQDYQDGYGSAYYYFKQHGEAMETYLRNLYTEKVSGSENWLTIQVDDSGEAWEVVTLTFSFANFEEYTKRLEALAYDETAKASYVAPTFAADDAGVTYQESTGVMTAIFKSIQTTIMADDTMYDETCPKDGVALNDGSANGQLVDYGVELMKPENGSAMTVQFNGGEVTAVDAVDGNFTFKAGASAEQPEDHETSMVLKYDFNENLSNTGTAADNDLTYGTGSTAGGPVYTDGIDGKAILLDGASYLASPNKTYNYKEMTVSFYFRMDKYTETDTGANMILVPAGLGALGSGMIDIEFINEADAAGTQLLGKMNSSNWQLQDKLYSDGYLMEAHLNEWHCYTLVFRNEYDAEGAIEDAFMYMYIDGKLAARTRLAVAAGLTYALGSYDDGSFGTPNGGFNVGGYYENEVVKRAVTGALDNLMVFDGALSEEEVNSLCYTVKVGKEYDPDVIDEVPGENENQGSTEPTKAPETEPTKVPEQDKTPSTDTSSESSGNNTVIIVVAVVAVLVLCAVVAFVVIGKKKKN